MILNGSRGPTDPGGLLLLRGRRGGPPPRSRQLLQRGVTPLARFRQLLLLLLRGGDLYVGISKDAWDVVLVAFSDVAISVALPR